MLSNERPSQLRMADDGKNTISSQLRARLHEAIVSGGLAAGSKINLDQLRNEWGVSLSPLREALARLTADGLVRFEDNRGYRVSAMSIENFEEVASLREQFEVHALREAIERGSRDWEGAVMRSLHRLNRSERDPARPETLEDWEKHHQEFHLTLLAGCGKPILLEFCTRLLYLNDRYRRVFLRRSSGDRNVAMEHSEIAQAAVVRDVDYACDRLRDHLARTSNNLRRHLQSEGL